MKYSNENQETEKDLDDFEPIALKDLPKAQSQFCDKGFNKASKPKEHRK